MYDVNKRQRLSVVTVGQLIDILTELPADAEVLCCGDSTMYLHVEEDDSMVSIDTEDLDDEYIDDPNTDPDEYWDNRRNM